MVQGSNRLVLCWTAAKLSTFLEKHEKIVHLHTEGTKWKFHIHPQWLHASWDNIQGYLCKSSHSDSISCFFLIKHSKSWMMLFLPHHLFPFPLASLQCFLQAKLLQLPNFTTTSIARKNISNKKLWLMQATEKHQQRSWKEKETNDGAIRWWRWGREMERKKYK